jgi:MFS family permease
MRDERQEGILRMAKTLDETAVFTDATTPARSLQAVSTLRLLLGLAALLGTIIFLEGTSWDIQWHTFIGRDRTLIPPHLMMLSGVTLTAALAFPLDAYWHSLYGIDVAIWAPFHIMFVASMGIVALGATYMLSSAAHLAARRGAAGNGTRRAATLGVVLALATALSLFTPLLSGLLVAFTLVAAATAIPWRWAATCVSVCYLVLAGIMAVFVQPATDWLLTVEHLHYRSAPPGTSIVALEWFLTPLVVAVLIDVLMRRARRKQWSQSKLTLLLALTALLSGALPVFFIAPLLPVELALQLGQAGSLNCTRSSPCTVQLVWQLVIAGSLGSLLLGLVGTYLGTLFGRNVGESLDSLER